MLRTQPTNPDFKKNRRVS